MLVVTSPGVKVGRTEVEEETETEKKTNNKQTKPKPKSFEHFNKKIKQII